MNINKFSNKLHDLLITFLLMGTATILAYLFFHFVPNNSANIALIYILALILTARNTSGYLYGIFSSLFCVICVNFLFTYPYLKFNFTLTGYPVTFIGMLAITLITSATTTHLKIQALMISEREEMLRNADKEKMRANLLRAISHDLRTPLTSIIGASTSYLENSINLSEDDKKDLVQRIHDDSNWLLNMVENLLSVTRIQNTKTNVIKTSEVIEEVTSEAAIRFKKRQPKALINISIPEEFLEVPMDPLLIEQVIINLLENAYVHSESKQPIELNVESTNKNITFHIRDYGKGIDPERLNSIFDGNPVRTDEVPDSHRGMGIGLSICKTIIEAHSGTIIAVNHNSGAEFIFTLPKGE